MEEFLKSYRDNRSTFLKVKGSIALVGLLAAAFAIAQGETAQEQTNPCATVENAASAPYKACPKPAGS